MTVQDNVREQLVTIVGAGNAAIVEEYVEDLFKTSYREDIILKVIAGRDTSELERIIKAIVKDTMYHSAAGVVIGLHEAGALRDSTDSKRAVQPIAYPISGILH